LKKIIDLKEEFLMSRSRKAIYRVGKNPTIINMKNSKKVIVLSQVEMSKINGGAGDEPVRPTDIVILRPPFRLPKP
jgi:hypothetical protein